jgi:hypothetical protein
MKKNLAVAGGVFAGLLVVLVLLGLGDVIDLPGWANVKGVDVPLIGDTDVIDCRLEQVDGTTDVMITIVDGDKSTYASYVHVWNNGNLVDPERVERLADHKLIAPSTEGVDEQFYAVSIVPVRDARVFCESITLR